MVGVGIGEGEPKWVTYVDRGPGVPRIGCQEAEDDDGALEAGAISGRAYIYICVCVCVCVWCVCGGGVA